MVRLLKSMDELWSEAKSVFKDKTAIGISYSFDKVFFFLFKEGKLICPNNYKIDENIHELRIFDGAQEIFVFRVNDKLKYRVSSITENSFENEYVLWGKKNRNRLEDPDRGFVIEFPDAIKINTDKVTLKVRNLYTFDGKGKMFIYDAIFEKLEGVEYVQKD